MKTAHFEWFTKLTNLSYIATVATIVGSLGFANFSCAVGPSIPSRNYCNSNTDCSGGVCDTAQHVCVAANATTQVVFAVSPPNGVITAYAAPTITEPRVVTNDAASTVLRLDSSVAVYGRIENPEPTVQTEPSFLVLSIFAVQTRLRAKRLRFKQRQPY